MRKMGYRMEFDRDEEYLIANVDYAEHFDELVCCGNDQPPIRIRSIPYVDGPFEENDDRYTGDLKSFIEFHPIGGESHSLVNAHETEEEFFVRVLYGQSEDWKPVGVSIDDVCAQIALVYKEGMERIGGYLYLFPKKDESIKILIEVDRPDGSTEKYHLYMEGKQDVNLIELTEYWPWGRQEIYFKGYPGIPEHPDRGYFYATVIEYRK